MSELHLLSTSHPDKDSQRQYDSLVGIDDHKQNLLDELLLMLDGARFEKWRLKHHAKGIKFVDSAVPKTPLILLSGEVGCGKTALATSIGTPLARALDHKVVCLETPSDIRGGGHVGEVSARITDAFAQAKARAKEVGKGLLVIDEADDLATSRGQLQAHHEDRAGLNVLVKQINQVTRERVSLAVLLITNRAAVLDAAIMRRAALHLRFDRPNALVRHRLFERMLEGTNYKPGDLEMLVTDSERATPYSFSDLTDRVARTALRRAWREDQPFNAARLHEALAEVEPSPLVEATKHW